MDIFTNDFEMPSEEQREGFIINNDALADWALRKIAERDAEFARLEEIAKAQIAKIEEHIDAESDKSNRDNAYLIGKLREYFETVESKETKTQKKYKLLSGSLIMQKPKAKPVYDKAELLEYVKSAKMDDFIKVEESVKWADLKKTLDFSSGAAVIAETGEVIDCIKVEDTLESFGVETN